ncbi:MAG: DUF2878 domain-containing protein [Thalassotalea sp.]|nr:DUF2878 domain-containing protein [Thalassotalea sp.]
MLLNLLAFNFSWLGLVLIGNTAIPFVLLWLLVHIYKSKQRIAELKLIISVTIIGVCLDSVLVALGVFIFSESYMLPIWLIVLWSAFSGTIAHSLNFLTTNKKLQFIVGFIFPPFSYLAGASLSKVELGYKAITTYFILAPLWGCLFIVIYLLKNAFYLEEKK